MYEFEEPWAHIEWQVRSVLMEWEGNGPPSPGAYAIARYLIENRDVFGPGQARIAAGNVGPRTVRTYWVTLGDPYAKGVPIIDASLWTDGPEPSVKWFPKGSADYVPFGAGEVQADGFPTGWNGAEIVPAFMSDTAREFLADLKVKNPSAVFDTEFWFQLGGLPVGGWPSKDVYRAMLADETLRKFVRPHVAAMLVGAWTTVPLLSRDDPAVTRIGRYGPRMVSDDGRVYAERNGGGYRSRCYVDCVSCQGDWERGDSFTPPHDPSHRCLDGFMPHCTCGRCW